MRAPLALAALLSGAWSIAAPAAASAPSLDGVWQIEHYAPQLRTIDGREPPLTPAALATYHNNIAARARGDRKLDPTMQTCANPGTPRTMLLPTPFEIIDRPAQITFLFGWNHIFRTVPVGKPLSTVGYATAGGTSQARHEGDVLKIHTDQLGAATFLDAAGLPHGDKLVVDESYALTRNGEGLTLRLRFEDGDTFTQPWEAEVRFKRLTDYQIGEDICLDRVAAGLPAVDEPR